MMIALIISLIICIILVIINLKGDNIVSIDRSFIEYNVEKSVQELLWANKGRLRVNKKTVSHGMYEVLYKKAMSEPNDKSQFQKVYKYFKDNKEDIIEMIENCLMSCDEFIKEEDGVLYFAITQYR